MPEKEYRPRMTPVEYELFKLLKEKIANYHEEFSDPIPEPLQPPKPTQFKKEGMYLLLGCVHAPGHNVAMMNGITNLITDYSKDLVGLVLMGDFIDLNSLSSHDTGRFAAVPGLTLDEEYEEGEKLLSQLVTPLSPNTEKIFLYGNHEDRYNRYMSEMESAKRPLRSPITGLGLTEKGFHSYTKWKDDKVTLGNHLDVFHGQYYNVHCAKKTIDVYRGSAAFVHSHRIQTYIEGTTGGFNIGWGGDVTHPFFNYAPRGTKSMWQNGFAVVNVDEKGDYHLQQIIHHNHFYFGGKKYS